MEGDTSEIIPDMWLTPETGSLETAPTAIWSASSRFAGPAEILLQPAMDRLRAKMG